MIVDGEGEFDQDALILGNNFKIKYEELFKVYNGSQCAMVLIKNVTTTSKGDKYFKAQYYTILTKIVDETTQVCLL